MRLNQARKNFLTGVFHETSWGASMGLCKGFTILPLALSDLGGSAWLAGVLGSLLFVFSSLPQLASALWIKPRFQEPWGVFLLHLPIAASTLLAGCVFLFVPSGLAGLKIALFLAAFALQSLAIGVVTPHWMGSMGRCIPGSLRGRYFGTAFFFSELAGAFTGWLASRWAAQGGLEWGYAQAFLVCAPLQLLSGAIFLRMRPLQSFTPLKRPPLGKLVAMLRDRVFRYRPFLLFVILAMLLQVSGAAGNLYTVFVKNSLAVDKGWFALYTPVFGAGSMAGSLLLGWLADRKGPRFSLWLAFGAMALSLAGIALLKNEILLALPYLAAGFFTSAGPVMVLFLVLGLSTRQNRTLLSGMFAALITPVALLASPALGALADACGYRWAFLVSGLGCLAAFAILATKPSLARSRK